VKRNESRIVNLGSCEKKECDCKKKMYAMAQRQEEGSCNFDYHAACSTDSETEGD
jgi:hypothetical protein